MIADPLAPPRPGAPRDPIFATWAARSLVWLPEHGMGRLRVLDAPYDADYFAKYEGYARTPMGQAITAARVQLVDSYTDGDVIDVGIGSGDFVRARANTWGYDVNPAGVAYLQEVGRWRDPYGPGGADAISLWDVLEHIPDPAALLRNVRRYVFVSLPIVPGDGPPPLDWKHLRRDEHCWYWTSLGFVRWMGAHGFVLRYATDIETSLGREDISTFAFERGGA